MPITKLTHQLIDLTSRSKLLKYPSSIRKSGYKVDLQINLEGLLKLIGGDINNFKIILTSSDIRTLNKMSQDLLEKKEIDLIDYKKSKLLEQLKIKLEVSKVNFSDKLKEMTRENKNDIADKGIHTLFISYYQLSWSDKKNKEFDSPILMIPVNVVVDKNNNYTIESCSNTIDVSLNPALFVKYKLEDELKFDIVDENGNINLMKFDEIKNKLIEKIADEEDIDLENVKHENMCRIGLYPLSPLWKATKDNLTLLENHKIINSIITQKPDFNDPGYNDTNADNFISSLGDHTVINADDSQLRVIELTLQGKNLKVTGAPGTGKSQTIINLISCLVATKKTVLFVCEKKVALDVVYTNLKGVELLDSFNLGDFCLHLANDKITKPSFCQEIVKAYDKRVINTDNFTSFGEILQIPKIDNYYKNLNIFVDGIVFEGKKIKYKELVGLYSKFKLDVLASPHLIQQIVDYSTSQNEIKSLCDKIWKNKSYFSKSNNSRMIYWKNALNENIDLHNGNDFINHLNNISSSIKKIENNLQNYKLHLVDFSQIYTNKQLLESDYFLIDTNFTDFLVKYEEYKNIYLKIQNNFLFNNVVQIDSLVNFIAESYRKNSSPRNSILSSSQTWKKIVSLSIKHQILNENYTLVDIRKTLGHYRVEFIEFLIKLRQLNFWYPLSLYKKALNLESLKSFLEKVKEKFRLEQEINHIEQELKEFFVLPKALEEFDVVEFAYIFVSQPKYNNLWTPFFNSQYKKKKEILNEYSQSKNNVKNWSGQIERLKNLKDLNSGLNTIQLDLSKVFAGKIDLHFKDIKPLELFLDEYSNYFEKYTMELKIILSENIDSEIVKNILELNDIIDSFKEFTNVNTTIDITVAQHLQILTQMISDSSFNYSNFEKFKNSFVSDYFQENIENNKNILDCNVIIQNIESLNKDINKLKEMSDFFDYKENNLYEKLTQQANDIQQIQTIFGDKFNKLSKKDLLSLKDYLLNVLEQDTKTFSNIKNQIELVNNWLKISLYDSNLEDTDWIVLNLLHYCDDLENYIIKRDLLGDAKKLKIYDLVIDYFDGNHYNKFKLIDYFWFNYYSKTLKEIEQKLDIPKIHRETLENIEYFKKADKNLLDIVNKQKIIVATKQEMIFGDASYNTLHQYASMSRGPRISIKKIINDHFDFIQKIKLVFICNPISQASLINFRLNQFDVVIFDEASQITLESSLLAIGRGKQLIVFGDQNQLSPDSDFTATSNKDDLNYTDDELLAIENNNLMEAISAGLPVSNQIHLKYHYRSKYGRVIDFINKQVYAPRNNDLNYSINTNTKLESESAELFYVKNAIYEDSSNEKEISLVIQKCIEYFAQNKTVGVITINSIQEEKLRDKINELYKDKPELLQHFDEVSENNPFNFFIKNTQKVQGDERDIIIISTVYGRNVDGRITQNFGYLNRKNSYKRVNVILTRAKEKTIIVTSLKSSDITPKDEKITDIGIELLRRFMTKLEVNQLKNQTLIVPKIVFDSSFEESVYSKLNLVIDKKKYRIDTQVNQGSYRIDMAILNLKTMEYILGIECDGLAYHSGASVRFKDRFRQSILESKGWNIIRVWSFEWRSNADKQVERILRQINKY